MNTARATLTQQAVSGGIIEPVLPLLSATLAEGEIGIEKIVATMTKLLIKINNSAKYRR